MFKPYSAPNTLLGTQNPLQNHLQKGLERQVKIFERK